MINVTKWPSSGHWLISVPLWLAALALRDLVQIERQGKRRRDGDALKWILVVVPTM